MPNNLTEQLIFDIHSRYLEKLAVYEPHYINTGQTKIVGDRVLNRIDNVADHQFTGDANKAIRRTTSKIRDAAPRIPIKIKNPNYVRFGNVPEGTVGGDLAEKSFEVGTRQNVSAFNDMGQAIVDKKPLNFIRSGTIKLPAQMARIGAQKGTEASMEAVKRYMEAEGKKRLRDFMMEHRKEIIGGLLATGGLTAAGLYGRHKGKQLINNAKQYAIDKGKTWLKDELVSAIKHL